MTISEAVAKRIDTLTHPSFGGNSRIKLHITEYGYLGPWVEIHDDATDSGVLEPPKVLVYNLPHGNEYEQFNPLDTKERNKT